VCVPVPACASEAGCKEPRRTGLAPAGADNRKSTGGGVVAPVAPPAPTHMRAHCDTCNHIRSVTSAKDARALHCACMLCSTYASMVAHHLTPDAVPLLDSTCFAGDHTCKCDERHGESCRAHLAVPLAQTLGVSRLVKRLHLLRHTQCVHVAARESHKRAIMSGPCSDNVKACQHGASASQVCVHSCFAH
jgi:hypothetical protein